MKQVDLWEKESMGYPYNGGPNMVKVFKGAVKNELEETVVQQEMASYLQLDNINFLIGAGCSSHIVDGTELGIPGMRKLYDDFFKENADFSAAGLKLKDRFDSNLEKMLEALGAIQVANEIVAIDKDIDEKIDTVRKFIRSKIIEGLHGKGVLSIYKDFYKRMISESRKAPINIFTTNYDLYNEQALDSLGLPYNNGFTGTYKRKFNPASYKYAYVEDMNLSKEVWERVPNSFNLYKIHGSISWYKDEGDIFEKDYADIGSEDTVMIYPTPLKDRTTLMVPYSDLFRNFESSLLKQNSVLVTLGYSFADDHINRLILNALAIPTFKLIVFGESDAITKLIELDDKRIIVINSDDKIHYFKNFVEKIMPEQSENSREMIDMPTVARIIKSFEEKK